MLGLYCIATSQNRRPMTQSVYSVPRTKYCAHAAEITRTNTSSSCPMQRKPIAAIVYALPTCLAAENHPPMLPGIKLFDLTGQVAIITGGSKGLGLAMAEGLASAGADVVLVSRKEAEAKAAAERVAADYGKRAIAVAADVGSQADTERLAARVLEEFGKIDILINNAGINIRGPIDKLTYDDFHRVQQTNVDGVWLTCRAVVPTMKMRKSGRIINVASTLGVAGLADRTPYATSKGAVVNMTRALAMELAPFSIPVNAICPGPFLTEMNIPIKDDPVALKAIVGAAAFARWADLQEIQGAAIYLASAAASFTTGSLVMVDGGWTAH